MGVVELNNEGGVEDGGYAGQGFYGEVLVGALYAGDHGLGGAHGTGKLALRHAGFLPGFGYLEGQGYLNIRLSVGLGPAGILLRPGKDLIKWYAQSVLFHKLRL